MESTVAQASRLDFGEVLRRLRGRHFAVMASADANGLPHAAGVVYGVSPARPDLYVMTRRHLMKARNIAANGRVAIVVPMRAGALGFAPPGCIQFQGTAELLERSHPEGVQTFRRFFPGRWILRMYDEFERRGETRVCFVRIRLGSVIFAYGVGRPIWRLVDRMEQGLSRIEVPAPYRGELP
jgi:pyridoxamine 5'-phosphate oxidase-like protein